ncbi:Pol polyprotein [Elysia marginata]|uniref:Pol polyprotein n=1 Tax=Elysia marginata TaxID=1093978 RepID=A0AAV4HAN1_9GAST|nr:Pol polyprotein [Elysia marginata]
MKIEAVITTGSQVSTINECSFRRHLQPHGRELERDLCPRLTASNGLDIQKSSYILDDVFIAGRAIPDRVFLIIKDPPGGSRKPCLLGMNIIGGMSGWAGKVNRQPEEEVPLNFSDTARSVGRLAKLSEAVNIPPGIR